ncbi:hypothetical protein V1H85_17655, partial [Maribacter flavus]|nr:hypothetical protein [Maribacter flavus]
NGYLTAEVDGSITNEIQTLSIAGNDLTLSNGGGTVTIPAAGAADWSTLTGIPAGFADDTDDVLDEAAVDGFVANNGYLTAEVDGSITNEIQTLSIAGNDLTLSNGGGTVTIPSAGVADWSTLTGIPAGFIDNIDNVLDEAAVDGFVANNGYLTTEVDGSITNEIQTLSIAGNDLTLSNGGGTVALPPANPNFGAQDLITTGDVYGNSFITAANVYPDYVFQKYFLGKSPLNDNYTFKDLDEIEQFVKDNNHLPGIKSVKEIQKQGNWNLTEGALKNLEKIEELFLHTIEQEKKIEALQEENLELSKELEALKIQVEAIKKMLSKKE